MSYYAVKKGFEPGIYLTWEECKKNTEGFKKPLYKKFKSEEEAKKFMEEEMEISNKIENSDIKDINTLNDDELIIYSDGSNNPELKLSSYGIVFIQKGKNEILSSGIVEDKNNSQNVIGEITGVLEGLKYAEKNNIKKVYIHHDYNGLSEWANGNFRAKTPDAAMYCSEIEKYKDKFEMEFIKVKGHSGVKYNEICDKLADNELKSLLPDKKDDWGYRSYKFTDEVMEIVLKRIRKDIDGFQYTIEENKNSYVYKCFLNKEKLSFQKYKFSSTNLLLIPINQSVNLYSIIITYLNEFNSVNSMIRSLNINNKTEVPEETIKKRLYTIAPLLKNITLNTSMYKLLLQGVYNLFLVVDNFKDCGFLTAPVLRALEGHIKQIFRDKLNIEIKNNNFHYFDKDDATGIYSLQQAHANNIDQKCLNHLNKCYNYFSMVRHKLFHFGDLDIDDTKVLTMEEAQETIIKIIKLIEEYYS